MRKLILVRAGSTAWEEEFPAPASDTCPADERRLQGTIPLPLTTAGKQALSDIAATVRLQRSTVLYSSGNESSGPTAACLAELCHLKAKKVVSLRELDCGLWQGLQIKDIKQRFGRTYRQWRSDPTTVCPPKGESIDHALQRVTESIQLLGKKNPDEVVTLVAAPIISGLIECVLTGKELDQLWAIVDRSPVVRVFEQVGDNTYTLRETSPAETAKPSPASSSVVEIAQPAKHKVGTKAI